MTNYNPPGFKTAGSRGALPNAPGNADAAGFDQAARQAGLPTTLFAARPAPPVRPQSATGGQGPRGYHPGRALPRSQVFRGAADPTGTFLPGGGASRAVRTIDQGIDTGIDQN